MSRPINDDRLLCDRFKLWNIYLSIFIILFMMCLSSCVRMSESRSSVKIGKALDENLIDNIEINATTMSEIFRWFGAPHHIVHGKGYEVESLEIGRTEATGYYFGDVNWVVQNSDLKWSNERSLDSIYEDWIMLIYEFHASYDKKDANGITIFPFTIQDTEDNATIGKDELVIFIDEDSQLVENYGFRKETGN